MVNVREDLFSALEEYRKAATGNDIKQALLALHHSLDQALLDYVRYVRHIPVDPRIPFPKLVNELESRTPLFEGDQGLAPLLISLNTTRNAVAHPMGTSVSVQEIYRDAEQLVKLILRFWPAWFGVTCPMPLEYLKPNVIKPA